MDNFFVNDEGSSMRFKQLIGDIDNKDYFHFMNKLWYTKLQKKKFCRVGEECPICLEGCHFQHNTWITWCGHIFHKKCLRKYYAFVPEEKGCPMCRGQIGNMEFLDGMRFQVGMNRLNFLDVLEEIDNMIPVSCCEGTHFIGCDKSCITCADYRRTGRRGCCSFS